MPFIVQGKRFVPNEVKEEPLEIEAPEQTDKYIFDKNKAYLVVDGEVTEIKKSTYLLDMLKNQK